MDISAIMMTILMTTTTTTTTTLPRTARLGSIHGSQSSLLTSPTSPSFPPQYTETLLNLPSETTTATTLTGALTYQSQQRDSSILTQQTTGSASSQSNLQSWVPLTSDSAQPASMMSPSAVTMMPHQKQAGVMASIPSTHLPSSLSMPYRADHVDLSASPSSSSKSCHMDDQYSLSHQPQYQPQYQQHQQLQQPTIEPDALPIFEPQHVVPMLREILRQVAPHVIAQAAGGHQQQNQQQSQQQLRFCQQQQQQQHQQQQQSAVDPSKETTDVAALKEKTMGSAGKEKDPRQELSEAKPPPLSENPASSLVQEGSSLAGEEDWEAQQASALAASWDADLLHQVCVDPHFRLSSGRELRFYSEDYPAEQPVTNHMPALDYFRMRVDHVARKALMDEVQKQLQAEPPNIDHLVPVLQQLQAKLSAVTLPRQQQLRETIQDHLHPQRVADGLRDGLLSFDDLRQIVLRFIKMLAAPSRDDRVAQLETSESQAAFLFNALVLLEFMQLDLANYTLEAYRPMILKYGAQVERDRVQSLVFSGALTFVNTEAWLHAVVSSAAERAAEPYVATTTNSLQSAEEAAAKMTFTEHFFVATEKLLFSSEYDDAFPETLLADKERLVDARTQLGAITHVCALYTLVSHLVPRLKHHQPAAKEFRELMLAAFVSEGWTREIDDAARRRMATFVISALNKQLDPVLTEEETQRIRELQFGSEHPVMSLLQKRVKEEYRRVIRTSNPARIELRSNNGLDLCAQDLHTIFLTLVRTFDHNRQVYSAVYDGIISNALEPSSLE
eukprot:m.173717 g.173717  ORF g.173717 m.173717 type:complete len:786 (-) comp16533_c13_seq2:977-3334(-)